MSFKVSPSAEPFLYQEAISSRNGQYLFAVKLCDLYGSELDLRGGRFQHFSKEAQELAVPLERTFASEASLCFWLREVLEWIANQADRAWSFSVDILAVDQFIFRFSFAHKTTAVVFALVWT